MLKIGSLLLLILILTGLVLLAGCGGSPGRINIAGSTSVQPVAEMLAESYQKSNPGSVINVQGGGSSAGIKAVSDGTAEIGTSSRPLHPGEQQSGVKAVEIALDGIAIISHKDNAVQGLTMEQLKKIYRGEISNWSQVGGKNHPVVVVNREDGSGTRGAFTELVMTGQKMTTNTLVQGSTGAVRQTVAGNPDAIGYISLAAADASVKVLAINGMNCTVPNIKAKKYPLVRPFLFIYQESNQTVAKFVNYVLHEGQQLIVKEGLVAVQ